MSMTDTPRADELANAIREHLDKERPSAISVDVEDLKPNERGPNPGSEMRGTLVLGHEPDEESQALLLDAFARVRKGFDSGSILAGRLGTVTVGEPEFRFRDRRAIVRLEADLRFRA
jgi:hypothetical protein